VTREFASIIGQLRRYGPIHSKPEVLKLWGAASWGALLVLWGVRVVFMRDKFVLNEIWAQDKIYIFVGTFLSQNMKLALVSDLNFTIVYINLENYVIH
jgi:hypothetical protein